MYYNVRLRIATFYIDLFKLYAMAKVGVGWPILEHLPYLYDLERNSDDKIWCTNIDFIGEAINQPEILEKETIFVLFT